MVSLTLDSQELAEQYDALSDLQFNNGKRLLSDIGVRRGQRLLDIGAGTGRLAQHAAQVVGDPGLVAAIDPLPLRIELARRRIPGARLEVGQAEDLSAFAAASFDYAIYNAVFHWLPDQPAALRQAARVLKSGGQVGITTGDRERPNHTQSITERVLKIGPFPGVPVKDWLPYRVSVASLTELFTAAGLVPVRVESVSFVDHFADAEQVLAFNSSSSFGNFLSELRADQVEPFRQAVIAELEQLRTPQGIRLERHTIFAIARKP